MTHGVRDTFISLIFIGLLMCYILICYILFSIHQFFFFFVDFSSIAALILGWLWDRTVWMKVWIKAVRWNPKDGHRTGTESKVDSWENQRLLQPDVLKTHVWKFCAELQKKKKKSDSSQFHGLLKPDKKGYLLKRLSTALCLPSLHPLPCQWEPQWLQVFPPCIGGVFLGTEPCFLSAYQQPLCAPPTNLADMALSFRTPQAAAAVTHSQPDLHGCPPPTSLAFDLCPTDPAQPFIIVLFLYSEQIFWMLGISCKSCRKGSVVNILLLCHHHALYRFSSEA